jgi:hypothetical protein
MQLENQLSYTAVKVNNESVSLLLSAYPDYEIQFQLEQS